MRVTAIQYEARLTIKPIYSPALRSKAQVGLRAQVMLDADLRRRPDHQRWSAINRLTYQQTVNHRDSRWLTGHSNFFIPGKKPRVNRS